ncbi:hypothetical protein AX768_12725 [Burkholderia sp. PAMC 28687]|nr:hypothetical protein AX768_12725 [Burkholderia sp. PAMC 28687]
MLDPVREVIRDGYVLTEELPGAPERSWKGHQKILRAIEKQDAKAARAAMHDHPEVFRRNLGVSLDAEYQGVRGQTSSAHRLVVDTHACALVTPAPGRIRRQRLPGMPERAFPFKRRACIDIIRRYQLSPTLGSQRPQAFQKLLAPLRRAVHAAHVLHGAERVVPCVTAPALPTGFGRIGRLRRPFHSIALSQRHQFLALERVF